MEHFENNVPVRVAENSDINAMLNHGLPRRLEDRSWNGISQFLAPIIQQLYWLIPTLLLFQIGR